MTDLKKTQNVRYSSVEDMVRDFRVLSSAVNKVLESLSKYTSEYKSNNRLSSIVPIVINHVQELSTLRSYLFSLDSMVEQLMDFSEDTRQKAKLQKNISIYISLVSKKIDIDLHHITEKLPNVYNVNLPMIPSNIYITCCPKNLYKVYVYSDKGISAIYSTPLNKIKSSTKTNRDYGIKVVDNLLWLPTKSESDGFLECKEPTTALTEVLGVRKILKPLNVSSDSPYVLDSDLLVPLNSSLPSSKSKASRLRKLLGVEFNDVSKLSLIKNKGIYWLKIHVQAILSETTQDKISKRLGIDSNVIAKWSQEIEDNL